MSAAGKDRASFFPAIENFATAATTYSIDSEQRKIDPYRKPEYALKPDG